jgi:hypothetical protein
MRLWACVGVSRFKVSNIWSFFSVGLMIYGATIPDSWLIYSRNSFNEGAINYVSKELEAPESALARRNA